MNNEQQVAQPATRIGTGWGFAIMLLGMIAVMTPFVSGIAVTYVIAIVITAAGFSMTIYAFQAGSFGKGLLKFLFGGITILCGLTVFATPVVGMLTLTKVLIAWFLVDGAFSVVAGIQSKGAPGRGWITVSGIASILLAILLYRQWPASGAVAIGLLTGIRLIFTGWSIAMLGIISNAAIQAGEPDG